MTQLETERLVRKITFLLQGTGNAALAPKLAEDFAAACHAVNVRLRQCEAMIRAADRHQAIQLAETSPNLLDVVTALEFRTADTWRAQCGQQGWAMADPIDARSVQALNACYAQGISTDHPLYATFRAATLARNDEAALQAIQSVNRLNPSDTNAVSELARLESKVLVSRLGNLKSLVSGASVEAVVAEIEAIEAFGFKTKPADEIWPRAQALRCGRLIEDGEALRQQGAWLEALSNVDLVRQLQAELKFELPPANRHRLGVLETWTHAEQEKDRRDREFRSLLAELDRRILLSEEKDTAARHIKLAEMKDDCEGLHKVWRALQDFTRAIPDGAAAAFRKRIGLLEAEILRRTRLRQRAILVGAAALLVIGGLATWVAFGRFRAGDLAGELNTAVSQRQVRTAEVLIARARNQDARLLSVGALNAAVASAEVFVTKERGLFTNYTTAFARLPKELAGQPSPAELARLADQLTAARVALNALAPDLRAADAPQFEAFERRWEKFLAENGTAVNGLLDQWITSAEKQAGELDYRSELEVARPHLAALGAKLQQIQAAQAGFNNHLQLRSDLLQRAAAVQSRFAAFDRQFKQLNEGRAALQKARTFAEYSTALRLMATSEFSATRLARAAAAMVALEPGDESALRFLLGATNASLWAFIKTGKSVDFVPEAVMPAERDLLNGLKADPAVTGDHQHLRLWLDAQGSNVVEWITAGPLDGAGGWKKVKAYAPAETPGQGLFLDHDYGGFDGRLKLSATQPIWKIEQLPEPQQAAAFSAYGLSQVLPTEAGGYRKSLLEVLDTLKTSREGSPLFRAYLFQRLVELMELQPAAWGLAFVPAIRADGQRMRAITGGRLQSGDWFVAGRIGALAGPLEGFFTAAQAISYAKQAAGLLALSRAAAKAGFRYAGFVDLDGKLILHSTPPSGVLWAYSGSGKQAGLLALTGQPASGTPTSALPLSPVFKLPVTLLELAASAGADLSAPGLKGALPPLLTESPAKANP